MRQLFFILLFLNYSASAQELFPHTEPASTIPKNVLGIRYSFEAFNSSGGVSVWNGLKAMYGVRKNLTLIGSLSASNNNTKKFPSPFSSNFQYHHNASSYSNIAKITNPLVFEGATLYAKYKFLNIDKQNAHLRGAFYSEISQSFIAARGAEPVLNGNNSGAGVGVIFTKLHKKIAISGTLGYIHPFKYQEKDSNSTIVFQAGKSFVYNLSFGYLLYPIKYKSYKDLNINLYVEFMNKIFDEASYVHHGQPVNVDYYPILQQGQYSEVMPALQFIINSNTRIDLSVSLPIYQRVETRMYPMYMINLQRYFY